MFTLIAASSALLRMTNGKTYGIASLVITASLRAICQFVKMLCVVLGQSNKIIVVRKEFGLLVAENPFSAARIQTNQTRTLGSSGTAAK